MKAFISYSSQNAVLIDKIFNDLSGHIIIDQRDFQNGNRIDSEIFENIKKADLFVALISEESLKAEWPKKEWQYAHDNDKEILPIIIDNNISFDDCLIPDWMHRYLMKPVTKAKNISKKIKEKLREIDYKKGSKHQKYSSIFVGRNDEISKLENRFCSLEENTPKVLFVSGFQDIGRKTFVKKGLEKIDYLKPYSDPEYVLLNENDGLDSFIQKVSDIFELDFFKNNLNEISFEQKKQKLIKIFNHIKETKQYLFIEDSRCIVDFECKIKDWFTDVVSRIQGGIFIVVVCQNSPKISLRSDFYKINLPEISPDDRENLFFRYCQKNDINICDFSKNDKKKLRNLFKGYPNQIKYCTDCILDYGINRVLNTDLYFEIERFSDNKAEIIINSYRNNRTAIEVLRFLSQFEFISFDYIEKAEKYIKENIIEFVYKFIDNSACSYFNSKYIKVSDIIRDALLRDFSLAPKYNEFMRNQANLFISNSESDEDLSEISANIKQLLSTGKFDNINIITPTHYIETLNDLYREKEYERVISLAKNVLDKKYDYDEVIFERIRSFFCLALVRTKKTDLFWQEVNNIKNEGEKHFLKGFFFRKSLRFKQAIEEQKKAILFPKTKTRAQKELVQCLINTENYDEAFIMAENNYSENKINPFYAQDYFSCLLHSRSVGSKDEAKKVLDNLSNNISSRGMEFLETMKARYEYYFENNHKTAFKIINDAISKFPKNEYAKLAKMEMAISERNVSMLKEILNQLKENENSSQKYGIKKGKIFLLALTGNKEIALQMVYSELSEFSDKHKDKIIDKIMEL